MRILFFTDLHIYHPYLDRVKDFLGWLTNLIHSSDVDSIIFLGDLFEQKDRISNASKKVLADFLADNQDFIFYWLVGNHDGLIEDISSLELLRNVKNSFLIKSTTVEDLGPLSITFIPYGVYPETLEPSDLVCFHNSIKGLALPNGFKFSRGLDFDLLKSAQADYYLGGHIHIPIQKESLVFLGSPIERDYRDEVRELCSPIKRGAFIFDSHSRELEFYEYKSLRFVHLTISSADLDQVLTYLKENYIGKGYPVSLWLESDENLPDFDRSMFYSCLVSLKVEETVVTNPQQLELEKTVLDFIPSKYRSNKEFLSLGKSVFKEVGIDLCI